MFRFQNKTQLICSLPSAPHYKNRMDSLTVIAIFILGASVGSLITTIRYRSELARLRVQLEQSQEEPYKIVQILG